MSLFGAHGVIVLEATAAIAESSEQCEFQLPLDVSTGHQFSSAPLQVPGVVTARADTCGFVYKTTLTVRTFRKKKKCSDKLKSKILKYKVRLFSSEWMRWEGWEEEGEKSVTN